MEASKAFFSCMVVLWLSLIGLAEESNSKLQGPSATCSEENLLDMSIEELMDVEVDTVYGAAKHQQTLSEAPASVTIITWRASSATLSSVDRSNGSTAASGCFSRISASSSAV